MQSKLLLPLIAVLLGLIVPPAYGAEAGETELFLPVATPIFELTKDGVSVPGYAVNNAPGAPQLPVYGTVLELPAGGQWELDFVSHDSRVLEQRVAVRAAPVPAAPSPSEHAGPDAEGGSAIAVEDRPDPAIYGRDAFYPASPVVAGGEQWQRGRRLLAVRVFPFQYNPITGELLHHPDLTVIVRVRPAQQAPATAAAVDAPAAGAGELGALRVRTNQQGMYRLTYDDLSGAGVPLATLDPAGFAMTYLGEPIRIQVIGGGDGRFDPGDLVIFYARPYTGRWMTSNVYRFSYAGQAADPATRMATRTVTPTGSEQVVTTVTQVLRIEQDKAYYSDYWIDTEADHFFDNPLVANTGSGVITRTYELALDDPVNTSGSVTLRGLLYGVIDQWPTPDHWAQLKLNDHVVDSYQWDGRTPYAIPPVAVPATWLDQPTNKVHLIADQTKVAPGITEYKYNPDFIELSYPATADAESDRINILALQGATNHVEVRVTGFSTDQVQVYDVRNPEQPVQLTTRSATAAGSTYTIGFPDAWDGSEPAPAYWLSTYAALLAPVVEVDQPTSWRTPEHQADYIAIVHSSLAAAIQPLLDRRAAQGLAVVKVNVQDIYDEFNYGRLHPNAIRAFLSYAYDYWNAGGARPKYVLLVGDGTMDFKGITGTTLKNLVPPFLVNTDPFIVETAADNRFVTFDGPNDHLPEMIISRIPAQSAAEVTNYVNKVAAYEDKATTPDGAWQKRAFFVADNDVEGFHAYSESLRVDWLPSDYETRTVYYNPDGDPAGVGYTTPAGMNTAIKQALNDGGIYMQWFGHASRFRWGSLPGIWNILDLDSTALNANAQLPFIAAYSCWEGYFHNVLSNYPALAEKQLLRQSRGSIGGLSPSGQHVGGLLSILGQGLIKSFFQDRIATMGDAVDAAKRYYWMNTGGEYLDLLDTSILFGDPALKLRLPVVPPLAPPDLEIARGVGASIDLRWSHLEPDTFYLVSRGASPYFDPAVEGLQVGTVDAESAGYAAGEGVSFTDDGAIGPAQVVGDVGANYFWVVRGANSSGVSGNSNRVGEFDFALVPGNG